MPYQTSKTPYYGHNISNQKAKGIEVDYTSILVNQKLIHHHFLSHNGAYMVEGIYTMLKTFVSSEYVC